MSCCPAEVYTRVRHLDPPRGGQGIVIVMQALSTKKLYAVKGMTHTRFAVWEALIARSLPAHPNVIPFERVNVPLPDHVGAEPLVMIRMPYCDQGDLLRYSAARQLSKADIVSMMQQVIDGVSHLHTNGICHRDLKPNNIFLASSDARGSLHVYVGDLGLCCPLNELAPRAGTPGYICHEVMNAPDNQPFRYTTAVDCFGVGMIMMKLLERLSSTETSGDLGAVASELVSEDPRSRPSLQQAKQRLLAMQ